MREREREERMSTHVYRFIIDVVYKSQGKLSVIMESTGHVEIFNSQPTMYKLTTQYQHTNIHCDITLVSLPYKVCI